MALLQTSPSPVAAEDVGDVVSASPVAADEFRDVVGRFASGVTVITTGSRLGALRDDGERHVLGLARTRDVARLHQPADQNRRRRACQRRVPPSSYLVSTRPRLQRISPPVRRRSSPGSQRRRASSGARCSTMPWPSSSAGLWNRWWKSQRLPRSGHRRPRTRRPASGPLPRTLQPTAARAHVAA